MGGREGCYGADWIPRAQCPDHAGHGSGVECGRARGGFEVDFTCNGGSLARVTLRSLNGTPTTLRHGLVSRPVQLAKGQALT